MIMNATDWNTALFEKMSDEQDKFRDWLKSQPPEEILHHTYEYTVREDIVMAMEQLELTDAQAQALLDSPSPLADVYRYFEKLETGYMDAIRDSIENRADDVCRAKEELRTTPVYPHSAAYASEHGEMAQYNLSYQANSACKEAIEQTISAHYISRHGCVRVEFDQDFHYCSGEVCHTPKELFDLLADDYRTYLEIELTKGKREVTEDDEREADALCKQYLERWKEEQK